LYPENARGERLSGQHQLCLHTFVVFSRNTVPVGFCWGGFSSTAGYVPGNEAYLLSHISGFTTFRLYLSKKCYSFLSEQLQKVFQLFFSKPFGFDSRRNSKSVPSVFALEHSVTTLPASPCIGQNTVMFLTYEWSLHPFFTKSSRKYFKFCLYFTG
jgi:hypothetical protein